MSNTFAPRLLFLFVIQFSLAVQSLPAQLAEMSYRGVMQHHERGQEPQTVKEFSLLVLADETQSVFWRIDEGGTGWHWPESFGSSHLPADAVGQVRLPGLLYQYDQVPWPIALPPLFLSADQRQPGKVWMDDRLRYEVQQETSSVGDVDCLNVLVTTNFGRAQKLLYHPDSGLLQSADVKFFLGRGDEFSLKIALAEETELTSEAREKLLSAQSLLLELQSDLKRDPGATRSELNSEQIALVEASLPKLDPLTENTSLQSLNIAVHRDLKIQQERSSSLEKLAAQQLGQPAPELKLTLLNGDPLPKEMLDDKVIVLHFWKYQDATLQEPYGQVGYLDFLNGKRGKLGVKFLGVAVSPEFSNPGRNRATMLQVKKLVSFMNLGYDIVRDSGALLEKFGDPRESNADLPLWVVIGADGKIRHYKVGFYDVNPREGLKELDEAIIQEIKARRANRQ